jgi:Flp pilus assembly protein TadD
MLAMFDAALSHGPDPDILNIQADYMLNVTRRPDAAIDLWRQVIDLRPGEPQYRINLAKVLIALGRDDEAREEIAQLRRTGRLGTNEAAARALEARFSARRASSPAN